ncbi:MAG: ABC transporter substrate-binding protein, partial [Mangrovicoccus sp.]
LLPSLAKSWSANEDASDYIIELRQDVTWSDGRALTAEDVAENFAAWADGTVAGNSMAVRLTCLQDPNTRQLRGDAVEILDDHHLRLRLAFPDITLMHSLADYPAAIQPRDHIGRNPLDHGIGTGAYRLEAFEPRQKAVLVRDPSLDTWRQAFLDKVEFLDFGIDPLNAVHAARADEIDMTYESLGDFIEPFIALGWQESQTQSSASLVLRPNQKAEIEGITPYADAKLRRALALAVRNDVLLELGHGNRGQIADNHHVAPIQPDYAESPLGSADPDAARQLMAETGLQNFIHEIVSVDGDWRTDTTAALVAQLNDAGIPARHKIVPSDQYWAGWKDFAFSATNWGSRELGIQTLALAYHSQAAWNETGYANPEF